VTGMSGDKLGSAMRNAAVEQHGTGFTMIEILIVVALVGLLLTIAVPQYRQFLQRGHRVEAVTLLTEAAACQERIRADTGAYDTDRCRVSTVENRYYQLTVEPAADESVNGFVVTAIPVNPSEEDACGNLSLDHTGRRRISGPAENFWACWSGR